MGIYELTFLDASYLLSAGEVFHNENGLLQERPLKPFSPITAPKIEESNDGITVSTDDYVVLKCPAELNNPGSSGYLAPILLPKTILSRLLKLDTLDDIAVAFYDRPNAAPQISSDSIVFIDTSNKSEDFGLKALFIDGEFWLKTMFFSPEDKHWSLSDTNKHTMTKSLNISDAKMREGRRVKVLGTVVMWTNQGLF